MQYSNAGGQIKNKNGQIITTAKKKIKEAKQIEGERMKQEHTQRGHETSSEQLKAQEEDQYGIDGMQIETTQLPDRAGA